MENNINSLVINSALKEIEHFVNWVKQKNPQLAENILGVDFLCQINNVEKLFEALTKEEQTNYQFSIDNEHNFKMAAKLGLLDASLSMPSGEPGHRLIKSLEILKNASVEDIPNLLFVPGALEIEEVGTETVIFEQPNNPDKNMNRGKSKGGTDMIEVLNKTMKDQAVNNLEKVRQVIYFTDGEPVKEPKPKQ